MKPDLPPPPAELARFTDLIGATATLALVRAFGGLLVYFPENPPPQGPLAKAIGLEAAQILGQAWARDRRRVPLARHWQARCLQAEGKNQREIARKLGVTETAVHDLLYGRRLSRETRDLRGLPPLQPDLFEEH